MDALIFCLGMYIGAVFMNLVWLVIVSFTKESE